MPLASRIPARPDAPVLLGGTVWGGICPALPAGGLAGGVAPPAQQTFVRRDLRATIGTLDHGMLPRVRIVFDLDGGFPDWRLETTELPLHGFPEVGVTARFVQNRTLRAGRAPSPFSGRPWLTFHMPIAFEFDSEKGF